MPGGGDSKSPKGAKGGGGAAAGGLKAMTKAAKVTKLFVPAISLKTDLPAATTGNVVQFTHGQRSERKATPYVHGVVPGSYIEPTELVDLDSAEKSWDGVNILKHFDKADEDALELRQMCRSKQEGSFSLSGEEIATSDWPRSDGLSLIHI